MQFEWVVNCILFLTLDSVQPSSRNSSLLPDSCCWEGYRNLQLSSNCGCPADVPYSREEYLMAPLKNVRQFLGSRIFGFL